MFCRVRIACVVILAATASCVVRQSWMSPGCAATSDYSPILLISATDLLMDRQSPMARDVGTMAHVPLQPDSIRAHAMVIQDQAVCREMGRTADHWNETDAYTVLRIGSAYWVRGSSWGYTKVLNDAHVVVARYVDE